MLTFIFRSFFVDMAVVVEIIANMEQYHSTNHIRKKRLVYLGTKRLGSIPRKGLKLYQLVEFSSSFYLDSLV